MRAVIQRVLSSSVTIDNQVHASIGIGLMVLLGIEESDNNEDILWLSKKIVQMRLFPDEAGVMNKSILEAEGDILLISQFTLYAAVKKGNRPSYIRAAKPNIAIPLYEKFIQALETELGKDIRTGVFGADMKVALLNDGPVTIWIDSKDRV